MRTLAAAFLLMLAPVMPAQAQTIEVTAEDLMAQGRTDGSQAGHAAWVKAFRSRALQAGAEPATFDRHMRGSRWLEEVVALDRKQNEFTRAIWDYLDIAVSDERIATGRKMLARHERLLARIEAEYQVPREIVVAVWGLESAYGGWKGTTPTLDALATLAYDGRRGAFFEAQLIAALKIVQGGEAGTGPLVGSWAGAMGHTQFMPSSWHDFAVDFDGDGRRDIWGDDPGDALASSARYLAQHGWVMGQPWGIEVVLPEGFDMAETSEKVVKSVAEWQALGVRSRAGADLPESARSSVLLPAGASGPAFLIYPNFQAIEAYNMADAYVIAIGHLADRLAGGGAIEAPWPRHWQVLSLDERHELQQRLALAGFDTGGVDGRMGPRTVASVKAWAKARGRVEDGFPSPEVLAALRSETRLN